MKSNKCLSWTFSIFSALSLSSTRLRDFGIMRHTAMCRNPSLRVSTDQECLVWLWHRQIGDIFNLAGEFINQWVCGTKQVHIRAAVAVSRHRFPHHQRIAEKAVKAKGNPFSDIVEKAFESSCSSGSTCVSVAYRLTWQAVSVVSWNTDTMANSSLLSVSEQQRWLRDTQPLLQRLRVAKGHHSHWQEQQRLPFVRGFMVFLCRNSRHRSWWGSYCPSIRWQYAKGASSLDGYAQVYCHLDNDEAGENACVELQKRYMAIRSLTIRIYTGYKDLNRVPDEP